MNGNTKAPTIGAWEYDEHGRKFRKIGNSIEYAMQITTTQGTVYRDELSDIQKRMSEEQSQKLHEKPKPTRIDKFCPWKRFKGLFDVNCYEKCAFYDGTGCKFSDPEHTTETKNKLCPFLHDGKCSDSCALYRNGCTLKM